MDINRFDSLEIVAIQKFQQYKYKTKKNTTSNNTHTHKMQMRNNDHMRNLVSMSSEAMLDIVLGEGK